VLVLLLCCSVTSVLWCWERCVCCGPGSREYEEAALSGYAGQWEGALALARVAQRTTSEKRRAQMVEEEEEGRERRSGS
jgi:hypothetical protein